MSLRKGIDAGAQRVGESVVTELPEDDTDVSKRVDAVLEDVEEASSELRETLSERLPIERPASEPPRVSD